MRKAVSDMDMNNFHRDAKAESDPATNACALCVSVNHCYFYNKPDRTPLIPTHPNCRCRHMPITVPGADGIDLDFPPPKVFTYLFTNPGKKGAMESIGYTMSDAPAVYDEIAKQARQNYVNGNYKIKYHDKRGVAITIQYRLKDKKHIGKTAVIDSGWRVRPYGKLINATTFTGREII
jgi:hypothetical protein